MRLLLIVAATTACKSQWYFQDEKTDIVTTNVVVRSEPAGATIWFDGEQIKKAPFTMPVDYNHATQIWARATNAGADVRDSTGPVGTVLLAPVWIAGTAVQHREEVRRHVYGNNAHEVAARWSDGAEAVEHITLNGEESVEVTLRKP